MGVPLQTNFSIFKAIGSRSAGTFEPDTPYLPRRGSGPEGDTGTRVASDRFGSEAGVSRPARNFVRRYNWPLATIEGAAQEPVEYWVLRRTRAYTSHL